MFNKKKRSREQMNYLKIAVKNMYELEDKRTDEIARTLYIPESEVVMILEDHGILNR